MRYLGPQQFESVYSTEATTNPRPQKATPTPQMLSTPRSHVRLKLKLSKHPLHCLLNVNTNLLRYDRNVRLELYLHPNICGIFAINSPFQHLIFAQCLGCPTPLSPPSSAGDMVHSRGSVLLVLLSPVQSLPPATCKSSYAPRS